MVDGALHGNHLVVSPDNRSCSSFKAVVNNVRVAENAEGYAAAEPFPSPSTSSREIYVVEGDALDMAFSPLR
jgi:hypothetical protein